MRRGTRKSKSDGLGVWGLRLDELGVLLWGERAIEKRLKDCEFRN